MHLKRLICFVSVGLCFGATGMTASAMAGSLLGAGSTLVAPLENEWQSGFDSSTGNTVQYDAVGSGSGIKDMSNGIVDFGASDAPLTTAQAASCTGSAPNTCMNIPWALSATGIGYNIPGIGSGLHLNGAVLSQIFLGQITNWDSSAIKKLNKKLHLPNLAITTVWRSDGSGDSYAFQNYLSLVNSTWSSKFGFSTTFPTTVGGVGKSGNSGVATFISSNSGTIGYVSASYLIAQHIDVAAIQNAKGNYEFPNLSNIENAAAIVHSVPASGLHIVDPPKSQKSAYPISTFTYAIVPAAPKQSALLKQFLTYAVTTGRNEGVSLDFAPIPRVVQSAALSDINSLS